MRMTKNRNEILDILKTTNKPLSAEDITTLLSKTKIDLSTIYRTLEYFDNNDLLLKFHFNNKAYYFLDTKDHHHYFICTNCLAMHKIDCNLHETLNDLENKRKFRVTNHEITIYGLCNLCS